MGQPHLQARMPIRGGTVTDPNMLTTQRSDCFPHLNSGMSPGFLFELPGTYQVEGKKCPANCT